MNNDNSSIDDIDMNELAGSLRKEWTIRAKEKFGENMAVDCYERDDVPGIHPNVDIIVIVIDKDNYDRVNNIKYPKQDVVDFVMKGIRTENPGVRFSLDQLVKPRP